MSGINEWDSIETPKEISIKEMELELTELKSLKEKYKKANDAAKEANAQMKEQEAKIIDMLKASGQKTFIAGGIGRATLVDKLSVKTPKSIDEKRALFNWIKDNLGEETRDAYMTVSSASLNKFYQEQNDLAAARGEVLEIDGLEPPSSVTTLSFKKA